jgi:uroporphyrinogen III methyltransferase/synthase
MLPLAAELLLKGKRILVTRARAQAGELVRQIERFGGEPVEFPTIEIQPPGSYSALDTAIGMLEQYDWLFFTSVNGVDHFLGRARFYDKDLSLLHRLKIVAIGPETANRLESAGFRPYLVPKQYQAEGILEGLIPAEIRGKRVLIARAAQARQILPHTLREWGGEVDLVEAYRTVRPRADTDLVRGRFRENQIDMITFTSSSTVLNFAEMFPDESVGEVIGKTAIACIGPVTSKTVEELGLRAHVVADEYTIPGLVKAIAAYFSGRIV